MRRTILSIIVVAVDPLITLAVAKVTVLSTTTDVVDVIISVVVIDIVIVIDRHDQRRRIVYVHTMTSRFIINRRYFTLFSLRSALTAVSSPTAATDLIA